MFKKVLIANRGEIALRVMATCREMEIATVAVYSQADRAARHVREADEAYEIGPAAASQSYLCKEHIVEVARLSGAEAIHPGYGFLSENPAFAEACSNAGIAFIGPPAQAMRLMGSKIAAKKLAAAVDAPTVPGYNGEEQADEVLLDEAVRIGFPLLIKASAGGGGKGMRTVLRAEDFAEQLAGARREAMASFADATVFLERLLQHPRHVEIQVLGDQHGNLIHLGERECSIQRRHQKIIEESPSPALTPRLRTQMGAAAVRIARAAGYSNAGTVEFMLDSDGHFYFLEMNTRLQVEHPVTELVTGFDLVRHQLAIAAGETLTIAQEEIHQRGHAIEVRLYAEDPEQNFLPSTGTITQFSVPTGPGIRVDSGVAPGDEITQFYDPMIAKLIVYGEDRLAALARLRSVLQRTVIFGVATNLPLLQAIAGHPAYREGATSTSFLEEHSLLAADALLWQRDNLTSALFAAALAELTIPGTRPASREGNPWRTLGPWRTIGEAYHTTCEYQGRIYRMAVAPDAEERGAWQVRLDEQAAERVRSTPIENGLLLVRNHQQFPVSLQRLSGETLVHLQGQIYHLGRRQPPTIESTAHRGAGGQTQKTLTAPMAGTIVQVPVQAGQQVAQRQILLILSAMKMEHTIAAPYAGRVQHVHYQVGDVVKGGAVLIEME
jgi:3-methylcrotonyl-CoA carboxylase alpha subunit